MELHNLTRHAMSLNLNVNPMKFCVPYHYRKQLDIEYAKLYHLNTKKFLESTKDLTDRQFRIVALRMFSGGAYTLLDIAEQLGVSATTVKYEYMSAFLTIGRAFYDSKSVGGLQPSNLFHDEAI